MLIQRVYDQVVEQTYMLQSCQHVHFMHLPKLDLEAKQDPGEDPMIFDIDHGHQTFHLLQTLSNPQELLNSLSVN